ncbi:hypothetical protein VTN77DRAFT_2701 [Rasamsonia byssochlamydoides]|uniref:uncharacterized protein n=1 Tax=Rasamsonia byssochlamydoides TaxID=89139 RepID=UPI003742DC12
MSSTMTKSPIGKHPTNHWTYDPETGLIDLSRHSTTSDDRQTFLTLQTATNPIRFDPTKSALVIIDMQNFFLEPALRGQQQQPSPGIQAANVLLATGIPAARRHGIRVVWVNWGLTDEEVETMPPAVVKAFDVYESMNNHDNNSNTAVVEQNGDQGQGHGQGAIQIPPKKTKSRIVYKGLGVDLGPIDLGDGTTVDGGRILMRDTWNAALYPPLDEEYRKGSADTALPDVWIHKNRMSALWGQGADLEKFLETEGITTLFFAGVNTDQCVGGTLMDAFSKGYDCILLRDGVATSSPGFATEAWEWNCAYTWGFLSSCEALMNSTTVV